MLIVLIVTSAISLVTNIMMISGVTQVSISNTKLQLFKQFIAPPPPSLRFILHRKCLCFLAYRSMN